MKHSTSGRIISLVSGFDGVGGAEEATPGFGGVCVVDGLSGSELGDIVAGAVDGTTISVHLLHVFGHCWVISA